MGWGELPLSRGIQQSDMGAGVLSVSRRLTARAETERKAQALADAVAAFLALGTTGNCWAMHEALTAFAEARKALDA